MRLSMDDIVKDFLIESNENLDRLDQELVKLEADPSSKELLGSIFRTIHTIKGSCGFLGFAKLEKLAHAGESLLSLLRDGKLQLNEAITSALLAMVDSVRQMLATIQDSGHDGTNDCSSLIAHLDRLQSTEPAQDPDAAAAKAPPEALVDTSGAESILQSSATFSADEKLADPNKIGGVLLERGHVHPEDLPRA